MSDYIDSSSSFWTEDWLGPDAEMTMAGVGVALVVLPVVFGAGVLCKWVEK